MTVEKKRYWTMIVYPDSAPENWRTILDEGHYAWIESPLHDKDVNADGEIKKAHWHIMIAFDGPMSNVTPNKIADDVNSPMPKAVGSAKGLVRYMIHLDNPEKYQYEKNEIIGHGGVDIDSFFELTTTNRLEVLKQISRYVIDNNIVNFVNLVEYAISENDDWFTVIADKNTLYINKLIDAQWQKGNVKNGTGN